MALLTENNGSSCTVDCVSANQQVGNPQQVWIKKIPDLDTMWHGTPIRWVMMEAAGKNYNVPVYDIQVYGEGLASSTNGYDMIALDHPSAQAYLVAVNPSKPMRLNEIPDAMDKMGWKVSAQTMRYWFSIKPAWVIPQNIKEGESDPMQLLPSQYDETIIKMDWILQFPRVKEAFEDLYANWASEAGIKQLKKRLMNAGWQENEPLPFRLGYQHETARELDALCQVNFRGFGEKLDTLDDLYGALGIASFKLAVIGTVTQSLSASLSDPYQAIFTVEKIGIYMRDTFDFTSSTFFEKIVPLGVWSRERVLSKAEMIDYFALPAISMPSQPMTRNMKYPGFVPVYNQHFRDWQAATNEGGDFVVYSDIKWMPVNVQYITIA
ncbi:MAG TPA: DUF6402 family protein [Candidatus Thiothrix moscowensis]|uniref:DUF6402 family protein n=1 Tax=unclassified Thiothrix TaxID=2636184 RepID=UPI0025D3416B|nr:MULTISPECIES: DUF6402 family protein [unclassified Thiothrix]HRJ54588.1 DUF6402 family protein [Candidatus Thiothrix moscowensis]HRJ94960.1 DUF6402 family protein [Candidatus Thiothrix moscowensis]